MANREKTKKELEDERQCSKQCSRVIKFYKAAQPFRGLEPRMRIDEAVKEIHGLRKYLTYKGSIECYEEALRRLEEQEEKT